MNNLSNNLSTGGNGEERPSKISRKRQVVKSFEAKMIQQRTAAEILADFITHIFGDLRFAILNFAWFLVWIFWNMDWIPGLTPFDPFPFGLLTMIVSLEAIFLSIFVLISQNRSAKTDKLRSEVDLQINLTSEQEITKVLSLLKMMMEKNGFDLSRDEDLPRMLKQIDTWEIERKLAKDLEESKKQRS